MLNILKSIRWSCFWRKYNRFSWIWSIAIVSGQEFAIFHCILASLSAFGMAPSVSLEHRNVPLLLLRDTPIQLVVSLGSSTLCLCLLFLSINSLLASIKYLKEGKQLVVFSKYLIGSLRSGQNRELSSLTTLGEFLSFKMFASTIQKTRTGRFWRTLVS